jgi:hypothetical protein
VNLPSLLQAGGRKSGSVIPPVLRNGHQSAWRISRLLLGEQAGDEENRIPSGQTTLPGDATSPRPQMLNARRRPSCRNGTEIPPSPSPGRRCWGGRLGRLRPHSGDGTPPPSRPVAVPGRRSWLRADRASPPRPPPDCIVDVRQPRVRASELTYAMMTPNRGGRGGADSRFHGEVSENGLCAGNVRRPHTGGLPSRARRPRRARYRSRPEPPHLEQTAPTSRATAGVASQPPAPFRLPDGILATSGTQDKPIACDFSTAAAVRSRIPPAAVSRG